MHCFCRPLLHRSIRCRSIERQSHGNNAGTLNDLRNYDAWGSVRAQQSAGDQKLRYCANLGHRQDDPDSLRSCARASLGVLEHETGLIYMRARYYEPSSGRFLSEDPALSGRNWFTYCCNEPVNNADRTGNALFTIGDYKIRLDWDINPEWGDLHVWQKSDEIISMFGNGVAHHKGAANVFTKDFYENIGSCGDLRR